MLIMRFKKGYEAVLKIRTEEMFLRSDIIFPMQSFQSLLGACCGTNGNKPYKEVYKCDARSLDVYPDSFFNTIISNCALEHIDGIELALKSSYRVLNKKGKLIMTVPSSNLNRWFPGSKEKLVKFNARQRHLNIYSIDEWRDLLNRIGFQIVEYYYIFDEKSYKVALFLDALPEMLSKFYVIYHYALKLTPKSIKRFLFRVLLKKYYIQSKPIIGNGGELVIVAQKNEEKF